MSLDESIWREANKKQRQSHVKNANNNMHDFLVHIK